MNISHFMLWIGGLLIGLGLGLNLYPMFYTHPYDQCRTMYETLEDISECMWILENE